jgi:phage shock protein A
MAEPLVVSTLRTKRDQIEGRIAHLEDRLKEARTDLARVTATLRLFEMDGESQENARAYMNLNRVFLCVAARDYT